MSVGILAEQYRTRERHTQDAVMCNFLKSFPRLTRLSCNLKLACLNSYLLTSGPGLTSLTCSALVLTTRDILVLRKYCTGLERLEGRLSVDNTVDRAPHDCHANHSAEWWELQAAHPCLTVDTGWAEWAAALARYPWVALRHLDLNGRLSARVMQLLVGEAALLETLSVTNWPNEMVAGGMAFDDSWVTALLECNSLPAVRELSLRMDADHYVEEGFLTKGSLQQLLAHAAVHCPKLERLVGEWTKVPDRSVGSQNQNSIIFPTKLLSRLPFTFDCCTGRWHSWRRRRGGAAWPSGSGTPSRIVSFRTARTTTATMV